MGTNYISPTWRMPKNINKNNLTNYSIEFDGGTSSQAVDCGDGSDVDITGPITISAFFNATTVGNARGVVCKCDNASSQSFAQYFFDLLDGEIRFRAGRTTLTHAINADQWYHAVGTYNGSNVTLYIDGIQVATAAAATTSYSSAEPMFIGRRVGQAAGYFAGRITQVCIFDYALDINQVGYLYNLNNPMTITGAEPIAYWPLGDNSNPNAPGSFPNISVGADSVFDFDGTNYINTNFQIGTETAYSFSAWFKMASAPANYSTILADANSSGQSKSQRAQLGFYQNFFFAIMGNGSSSWYDLSSYNISAAYDNNWHNITLVINGTSQQLYLDGSLVQTYTSSISAGTAGTQNYTIGRYGDYNGHYFDGELSNVQIWDTDLQLPDVVELYNNGQPLMTGTQPQEANLQAWYKLNQSEIYNEAQLSNWTISRIGNPNYGGSNDGCYSVNPGLRWHDNNFDTVSSDYFQWNSPTYKTNGTNIVLSSSGGEWVSTINGNEIVLEYSIDGGAWTLWHQELNPGFTGSTPVTFTIPSTASLTVTDNIRVRVKGVDYGSTSPAFTYIQLYNIQLSGGTLSYNETFNESQRYGWFGNNGGLQPPTEYIEDPYWEIQNSASPSYKSFKINGVEPSADDIVGYSDGRRMTGDTGTMSAWIRLNKGAFSLPGVGATANGINVINTKGYASREFLSMVVNRDGSIGMLFRSWSTAGRFADSQTGLIEEDKWYHIALVQEGGVNPKFYINGEQVAAGNTGTNPTVWWGSFNPVSTLNPQVYAWGIGNYFGSYQSPAPFDGIISNAKVWNVGLLPSEISEIYNGGIPQASNTVRNSDLVIDVPLDQTSEWYGAAEFGHGNINDWVFKNRVLGPANALECLGFSGSNQDTLGKEKFELSSTVTGESILLTFWLKSNGAQTQPFTFDNQNTFGFRMVSGYIYIYGKNGGYVYTRNYRDDYAWHQYSLLIPNTTTFTSTDIQLWIDNTKHAPGWSVSGTTTFDKVDINGLNVGPGSSYEQTNSECLYANWAVIPNFDASGANLDTLWNNGTPGDLSVFNPAVWYKLNSNDVSFNTTGSYELQITDSSSNGIDATGPYDYDNAVNQKPRIVNDSIVNAVGSHNTEENQLLNRYVSTLNGESEGMNSTSLAPSNLTKAKPFSSYSTKFDGIDYYTGSSGGFFNGATTASISVWMKMDDIPASGQYHSVASCWGGSPQNQYLIRYRTGNSFEFYLGGPVGNNSSFVVARSTITAVIDTWYNIVGTWNGSELKIYVNGQFGGSETATSGSLNSSTQPNLIGRYSTTNINGNISNAAYWVDTVLNEDDILNIYNNGITQDLSNFRVTPTNWFPLDESYTYYNGSVMVARDVISVAELDGVNIIQSDIAGNAPGSDSNGSGSNIIMKNLKGESSAGSKENAYSINMGDYADGVTNPANSGRSIDTP